MKRPKRRKFPHRRRKSKKTDYKGRLAQLKSGKHRLIVRRHLRSISCQIIEYKTDGDKTIVNSNSLELPKFGWKIHTGNISAAYLAGFLCGQRAIQKNIKAAVLDMGLSTSTKASGIYAAIRGALDAGLDVPHSEEILPDGDRIRGIHIKTYAELLKKDNPSRYKAVFSRYIKNKVEPESVPEHFDSVKGKIEGKKAASKTKTSRKTP